MEGGNINKEEMKMKYTRFLLMALALLICGMYGYNFFNSRGLSLESGYFAQNDLITASLNIL